MKLKTAIYRFLTLLQLENRLTVCLLALLVLNPLCECPFFNLVLPNLLHLLLQLLRSFPTKAHHRHTSIHRLGV